MNKLSVKGLALAGGVLWSFYTLLIGLAAWLFNWGTGLVSVMASLYIGFSPTLAGSLIGAAWAFIDGVIGGAVIAWVYNKAIGT